jgi:aspartyl protease family protein
MSEPDQFPTGHGPWGPEQPPAPPPQRLSIRPGAFIWLGLLAGAGLLVFLLSILVPGQTLGGEDNFAVMRLLGLAALVSSGLLTIRRIDLGRAVRWAAVWVAIIILLVIGYADRADFIDIGDQLRAALFPAFAVSRSPREMVVGRSDGGAFFVMAEVNGAPVRFLIDTGSSEIVLSPADAARTHVDTAGATLPSETANGVGYGAVATVDSLTVGPIRMRNVPVAVNKAPMSESLLGMSFLRRLESFEVRGDEMILKGKTST